MAVTLRSEKGNPLTYSEMDANFNQVRTNETDISTLQTDLSNAESNINSIENDISTINTELSNTLKVSNNFSDVGDVAQARNNIGVYSKTESDNSYLAQSNNLSDVDDTNAALQNLGIGNIAERDLFTSTAEPSNANGDNGDVWFQYGN